MKKSVTSLFSFFIFVPKLLQYFPSFEQLNFI